MNPGPGGAMPSGLRLLVTATDAVFISSGGSPTVALGLTEPGTPRSGVSKGLKVREVARSSPQATDRGQAAAFSLPLLRTRAAGRVVCGRREGRQWIQAEVLWLDPLTPFIRALVPLAACAAAGSRPSRAARLPPAAWADRRLRLVGRWPAPGRGAGGALCRPRPSADALRVAWAR